MTRAAAAGRRFLKPAAIGLLALPAILMAASLVEGTFGPNVLTTLIRRTGVWTVRLLVLTLAVTPARHVFGLRLAPTLRRPIGVATACYAGAHLSLYVAREPFALLAVAAAIVRHVDLLVGSLALIGLALLAATSTDAMVRRLGRQWRELHRLIFPIALLGLLHFFMQAKLDVSSPSTYAGLALFLMLWRAFPVRVASRLPVMAGLVAVATLLTAMVEVGWYQAATRVPAIRVLEAEVTWRAEPRPASVVALSGLALLLAATIVGLVRWRSRRAVDAPRVLARM